MFGADRGLRQFGNWSPQDWIPQLSDLQQRHGDLLEHSATSASAGALRGRRPLGPGEVKHLTGAKPHAGAVLRACRARKRKRFAQLGPFITRYLPLVTRTGVTAHSGRRRRVARSAWVARQNAAGFPATASAAAWAIETQPPRGTRIAARETRAAAHAPREDPQLTATGGSLTVSAWTRAAVTRPLLRTRPRSTNRNTRQAGHGAHNSPDGSKLTTAWAGPDRCGPPRHP